MRIPAILIKKLNNLPGHISKIFEAIQHRIKFIDLVIVLLTAGFFALNYYLLVRNNRFFSGDQAMAGIMLQDLLNGKLGSLYFYGQNYFGNLAIFVQAPLFLITGINEYLLYFWDYFFYGLSILLVLLNTRYKNYWTLIPYLLIFFGYGQHLYFTGSIQGFSFVVFILTLSLVWMKKIIQSRHVTTKPFVAFAALSAISLWHYPLYIFLFPAFLLIIVYKAIVEKTYQFSPKHLVFSIFGGVLGLIPLILGTLEKGGKNFEFFSSGGAKNYIDTSQYIIREYFAFFQYNVPYPKDTSFGSLLSSTLSASTQDISFYIPGLLTAVIIILTLGYGLIYIRDNKQLAVNYIFLFFLYFILLNRSASGEMGVFQQIRYSVAHYFLIFATVFEIVLISLSRPISKLNFPNVFCKFAPLTIIVLLSAYSLLNLQTSYKLAHRGFQYNQIVSSDLKDLGVKKLICFDYYQICSSLIFWGNNKLDVYIFDEPNRNPRFNNLSGADLSSFYSLVRQRHLKPDSVILKEYRQSPSAEPYYLIKGSAIE